MHVLIIVCSRQVLQTVVDYQSTVYQADNITSLKGITTYKKNRITIP